MQRFQSANLAAFAVYFFASVIVFGLAVIANPATSHIGYMNDPAMMIWCMVWWPYALGHGINPFITHAVWAPGGYNLTWSASVPAIATALAPVTLTSGPVVSYNLAALLAPALSGWSAFLLCRHLARNLGGALAGGFLYGFSPYEVGHVLAGHLNLTFVFIPPLCVLLVLLLVAGELRRRAFAATLAFLLVIQCLISTEVLATMTLFGAIALLAAPVVLPQARSKLAGAAVPIACAYAGAAIVLAPFLYYVFAKGSAPAASIFPSSLFSSDLLSFIVPPRWILIYPHHAAVLDSRLVPDINFWEKGSYFSAPLIGVAGLYFWQHRRQPAARLLLLLLVAVTVAALGPILHVDGRSLAVLPWAAGDALPLIRHALPIRFANYGFLILAIVVSLWLTGPRVPFRATLAVAVLVALVPNPLFLLTRSTYKTPAFFAQRLYRDYLHAGDNVLVIPYGANGPSMAWQAESWLYFRMPGGYLGFTPGEFRRWPVVNTLLTSLPVAEPAAQFGAFAAAHGISSVVVAESAAGYAGELPRLAGLRGVKVGGVSLYRVARNADSEPPLEALELTAADSWYAELLCAADRFVTREGGPEGLTPASARAMGLLPDSKWGSRLDLVIAGASHGAFNGLWVGPGANGLVEVGTFVPGGVVGPLAARYRTDVSAIAYPYPHPYGGGGGLSSDDAVHFMLMTLRCASMGRFCFAPASDKATRTE